MEQYCKKHIKKSKLWKISPQPTYMNAPTNRDFQKQACNLISKLKKRVVQKIVYTSNKKLACFPKKFEENQTEFWSVHLFLVIF
jgi:hypothetical protein